MNKEAISGETNVLSLLMGREAASSLAAELGRFVVTTMEVPWQLARDRIGGEPLAVQMVDSMEFDVVEAQIRALPPCDAVLAIGGGRAIDFGKYMASLRGRRLISLPTVLSVDAFVTPQAGLRRNHRVEYVGHASPDPLVIDFEILRTAPNELNIAGAGDLPPYIPQRLIGSWLKLRGRVSFHFPWTMSQPRALYSLLCENGPLISAHARTMACARLLKVTCASTRSVYRPITIASRKAANTSCFMSWRNV